MTAPERLDVVVVGGGQAGLAAAWHLSRHGSRYVVLEAATELGHSWRTRWASLRLFTPAEHDALPGMPFPAPPATYPGKTRSRTTCRRTPASSICRSCWVRGSPGCAVRRAASTSTPPTAPSRRVRWS